MPFPFRKKAYRGITVITTPRSSTVLHGVTRSYSDLYLSSHAVRTCIDWLARSLSQYEPTTMMRDKNGERPIDNDQAREAFGLDPCSLLRGLVSSTALTGNGFAPLILDAEGRVRGLTLTGHPVDLERPMGGAPTRYVLQTPTGPLYVATKDMLHTKLWNPTDPFFGVSPLDSLRHLLAEDDAASRDRQRFFNNSARPGGWIEAPVDSRYTDEARESLLIDWEDALKGDQEFRTGFLPDGLSYKDMQAFGPRDAQFIESRMQILRLVAAALGVPPQLVGATDRNLPGAARMREEALAPWVELLECAINAQLTPRLFGDQAAKGRIFIRLVQPAPATDSDIGSTLANAVKAGYLTPNDARRIIGLPPHADGDRLMPPPGTMPTTDGGAA